MKRYISHQANANENLNDNTSHLLEWQKFLTNRQKQNLVRMWNKWNQSGNKWNQTDLKTVWQLYTVKIYTYPLIQQFKRNKNIDVHQKTMNVYSCFNHTSSKLETTQIFN